MEINLKDLKEGKNSFDFGREKGNILELENEKFKVKYFNVYGEITKSRLEYFLNLNVKSKIILECARCLENFEKDFEERGFYHVKLGKDRLLNKKEIEISEDDINTIYLEETVLNLIGIVRELILLSIPMKPLCKEDCKGLCPICGKNKNKEECTCETQEKSPLSKIKEIFNK